MRLVVTNKYDELDTYECKQKICSKCGLKFVCFTERNEAKIGWKTFINVLKGKDTPELENLQN